MQPNETKDDVVLTPEFLTRFYYDNPPARVDYEDPKQIINYLRALLDLHDLLERGYDTELRSFLAEVRRAGWGSKQIAEFMSQSSFHTRYESLIDPPIPSRGSSFEYKNNSYRWRH